MALDLTVATESAIRVRVDIDEQADRKRRRRRQPLIETADLDEIAQFKAVLACEVSDRDASLMQWPTLVITLQGITPADVTPIGYLHPGWLRQESWGQDRRLIEPELLVTWLRTLGWTPP